jgi:Fur family ferric uptake transcriptional regulator
MTRQRKVILEEIRRVRNHPSADQVYLMVRKRLPHISLATVYRNLDILSAEGAILKLEMGGGQRRYDGETCAHHHVRCVRCGRIGDIPEDACPLPDMAGVEVEGFLLLTRQIEFTGLCRHCAASREAVAG